MKVEKDGFAVWACKIGIQGSLDFPLPGMDAPMRAAIQKAFFEITGKHAEFTFSGWNAELTEGEKGVIVNVANSYPARKRLSKWKKHISFSR